MSENTIPEGINDTPDPSAFEIPEEGLKKGGKKRGLEPPGGVTMNSLLDIMTILLVFLLKSFSTDPVQLKQSDDLKPPFSTSHEKPKASTVVTVTVNRIAVDDDAVSALQNGVPDASEVEGNYLIQPLFAKMNEARDAKEQLLSLQNSEEEFEGLVTIVADRNVPSKLIKQVMYTAGQAQFAKFTFMVVQGGA